MMLAAGYERHFGCRGFAHKAEIANHAVERKKEVKEGHKRENQHSRRYNLQHDS
jgi:hypothetical protein